MESRASGYFWIYWKLIKTTNTTVKTHFRAVAFLGNSPFTKERETKMKPIVLIKYGKKKHLKQLVRGLIRFAPTEDYIKLQGITGEKGQGDSDEGKLHISSTRAIMQPPDNPNTATYVKKTL